MLIVAVGQPQALVQERRFPAREMEHASHCPGNFHPHCPPFRGEKAEGYRGDMTQSTLPAAAESVLEATSVGPKPQVMGIPGIFGFQYCLLLEAFLGYLL